MTVRAVAGKHIAVLTRNADNAILFRAMRNVRKLAEAEPVLRVTLDNGASFRVAPYQILFTDGMQPVAASALVAGTALHPAFHFPRGYEYRTDGGETRTSNAALVVRAVAADGVADVYALEVNQTGCFFLSAGVLCQAERD